MQKQWHRLTACLPSKAIAGGRRLSNGRGPCGFDTLRGMFVRWQQYRSKARRSKMTDISPELEKEADEEFEKWLDDYIAQYRQAIDRDLM
jgi:hypothetical protein